MESTANPLVVVLGDVCVDTTVICRDSAKLLVAEAPSALPLQDVLSTGVSAGMAGLVAATSAALLGGAVRLHCSQRTNVRAASEFLKDQRVVLPDELYKSDWSIGNKGCAPVRSRIFSSEGSLLVRMDRDYPQLLHGSADLTGMVSAPVTVLSDYGKGTFRLGKAHGLYDLGYHLAIGRGVKILDSKRLDQFEKADKAAQWISQNADSVVIKPNWHEFVSLVTEPGYLDPISLGPRRTPAETIAAVREICSKAWLFKTAKARHLVVTMGSRGLVVGDVLEDRFTVLQDTYFTGDRRAVCAVGAGDVVAGGLAAYMAAHFASQVVKADSQLQVTHDLLVSAARETLVALRSSLEEIGPTVPKTMRRLQVPVGPEAAVEISDGSVPVPAETSISGNGGSDDAPRRPVGIQANVPFRSLLCSSSGSEASTAIAQVKALQLARTPLAYVPGVFDGFHAGHYHLLSWAAECDMPALSRRRLIVLMPTDEACKKIPGKSKAGPVFEVARRATLVLQHPDVSFVVVHPEPDVDVVLAKLAYMGDLLVKGAAFADKGAMVLHDEELRKLVTIRYAPMLAGISSTAVAEAVRRHDVRLAST